VALCFDYFYGLKSVPMFKRTIAVLAICQLALFSNAQVLGGGTQFSNAALFNTGWTGGCPSGATTFSNELAYESTTTLDPCAPAPTCATGNTGSDVWFSFFAEDVTATIVVNPSAAFNVGIQAFSGTSCPGLTDIGCADKGGNNETETLQLTGLILNKRYYFRIFGSSGSSSFRTTTGTYNFCGSAQLGGSMVLAVDILQFTAQKQTDKVLLNWITTTALTDGVFNIERSTNGTIYETIGTVTANGPLSRQYNFTDKMPLYATVSYYRLKQVSNNGSYKYSAAVTVKNGQALQKSVIILSNPVNDYIKARISSDVAANMTLSIINTLGQVIYTQKTILVKGDNMIAIPAANCRDLGSGIYTLQAVIDNEVLNKRFESIR
jgi:hypothetical protein